MYTLIVILLVIVGVGLLVAEMFLLPGFGIAGISGFGALVGAVAVAYLKISHMAGHIVLAASLLLSAIAIYWFFRSHAIEKMGLDSQIDSKVDLADPGKKINELKK